jgi:hypothetical protein
MDLTCLRSERTARVSPDLEALGTMARPPQRERATMEITSFDDLLQAARAQPEPQRLMFVFAGATLPGNASAAQRASFDAGAGGELAPLMCVDKTPESLADFTALAEESRQIGPDWAIVFAAALPGRAGQAPSDAETEAALQRMVEAVRGGAIGGFIPFGRDGLPVQLFSA